MFTDFFTSKIFIKASLLAVGLLFLFSCGKNDAPQNIILITLDTQRADFISAYDPSHAATPNLDLLAKSGILYENCFTHIPITLPSHASLFYSLEPHVLQVYNNGQPVLPREDRISLVKQFKEQGFTTAAFISLMVLNPKFGLHHDFDFYNADFPEGKFFKNAAEINQDVFPWLEQHKDEKFFLWLHYSDPHRPYYPPYLGKDLQISFNGTHLDDYHLDRTKYTVGLELKKGTNRLVFKIKDNFFNQPNHYVAHFDRLEFPGLPEGDSIKIKFTQGWSDTKPNKDRSSRQQAVLEILNSGESRRIEMLFQAKQLTPPETKRRFYREEVEYLDENIGMLWNKLRELNLYDKSSIFLTGDHGEGLGEFNNHAGTPDFGHIRFLYRSYVRVPLIIHDPGSKRENIRISDPVTLIDLAPTIAEVMGFDRPDSYSGRDLFSLKKTQPHLIFLQTHRPQAVKNKFGLLDHPWHLVFTPEEKKYELFNLEKDPEEKDNLFDPDNLPEAVLKMLSKLNTLTRDVLKNKIDFKPDNKTEEILRALGYIK